MVCVGDYFRVFQVPRKLKLRLNRNVVLDFSYKEGSQKLSKYLVRKFSHMEAVQEDRVKRSGQKGFLWKRTRQRVILTSVREDMTERIILSGYDLLCRKLLCEIWQFGFLVWGWGWK